MKEEDGEGWRGEGEEAVEQIVCIAVAIGSVEEVVGAAGEIVARFYLATHTFSPSPLLCSASRRERKE